MPEQTIDGNATTAVIMQNHEWQVVLSVLRKAPYDVVAPLIEKIVGQCVQQAMSDAVPSRTS